MSDIKVVTNQKYVKIKFSPDSHNFTPQRQPLLIYVYLQISYQDI